MTPNVDPDTEIREVRPEEHAALGDLIVERLGFRRAPDRDWRPEPGVNLIGYELDLHP